MGSSINHVMLLSNFMTFTAFELACKPASEDIPNYGYHILWDIWVYIDIDIFKT